MQLNKNIVLLGMMGSGKSTIGYLLSKKLDLNFKDVDKIIEKEDKNKISQIFLIKGESYFRKLEEKVTLKLLKTEKNIIALGGGGFINENIRKEVLSRNLSFWLFWNNSTITKRIYNSKKRPLAFNLTSSQINDLITTRSKIYSQANFKINCEKLTKNMIIKKIIKIYEKK
tara:strand:+ start:6556 stop:7068 length:513 start_codon:yes stop_codon:yes gene_type:complete